MTASNFAQSFRKMAILVLLATVCHAQPSRPDTWKVALKSPQIFVQSRVIEKSAPRSIVLIGENHASVKTQEQLADLLQSLYKAHAIDAILVEGSYGPIDAAEFRSSLGRIRVRNTSEFWRGKLALGQIAGYEYVALTQKGEVRVFGVEDMDAKREYTAGAARRSTLDGLREEVELHQRAINLAKQATLTLDENVTERSQVMAELTTYEGKISAFAVLAKTDGPKYARAQETYTDNIERMTALYSRLRPVLPGYERVRQEAEAYKGLVEQAKQLPTSSGSAPPSFDLLKFAELNEAKNRLEQASANFDTIARQEGYPNTGAVLDDLKQITERETELTASDKKIVKLASNFNEQRSQLLDQFFIVANAIRTATGQPIPELQGFLRNERKRIRTDKRDPELPYLNDRDRHMVSNALAYFADHTEIETVAMIVGYAHLKGMTERLAKEQVNVLAGKLSTSENEIEPWEDRAWAARSRPAERVFSSGTRRKEVSRLLDEIYKSEMTALLSRLQSVSTGGKDGLSFGKTSVFEMHSGSAGTKAIVVTPDIAGLQANWGSYVVDSGTLPDGSGAHYLVFDRVRARQQAKEASSATTLFAPAYRTRTAQGVATRIDLPTGTISIDAFKTREPKSNDGFPERVVLAAEGDATPLNTALGAGGGSGEPPWTTPQAQFAKPPERRHPFVLFTKNISRARARLKVLEKQEPLRIGQIASFELGLAEEQRANLDELWFTPVRGDHARAFFISGENTEQFRKQLKDAADAGLLQNKQIALATCFDPKETDALREMLLDAGAVMVWTPENRISPEAAKHLGVYMQKVDEASAGSAPKALDDYVNRALELWYKDSPDDPDLRPLLNASRWVELRTPRVDAGYGAGV